MSEPERVRTMLLTLLGNGFVLDTVRSEPTYTLFECHRLDEFAVPVRYDFILCGDKLPVGAAKAIARGAATKNACPVVICEQEEVPGISIKLPWEVFEARLGGPIKSWLPLTEDFAADLDLLGHNRPISKREGAPNELFEEYVHVALQFLLWNRVIRYGKDRRGEAVPDGVGLGDQFILLYDAKAYSDGYSVTLDSVRQFESYVEDFNRRYAQYMLRVHAFLVVSGEFQGSELALESKADEMYSRCSTRLAYMTAKDLGGITKMLAEQPQLRGALDWRRVFSSTFITAGQVEREARGAGADRVIATRKD